MVSRWRMAHFVSPRPIYKFNETHVSLERKPSVLEKEHLGYSMPVRIDLVFERNPSFKSEFKKWGRAHFVPDMPIQVS
jgi:hypothetical protein